MPIYRQISDNLRSRISAGEFAATQKLPSCRELAEFYEVNHLTVRHALKLLDSDGLINIEHGRGAFLPANRSRELRTALVLPSLGHEQSGTLSRVIREALGPDATIHVLDYHGNPAEEATCLGRIVPEGFTSAIVYPSMRGESIRLVLKLLVEDFPLVFLDRAFTEVPACSALADNRTGGYLATKHLLSKGCRRIACFTDDLPTSYQRLRGYRDALGEAAVPFDTRLIVKIPDEEEAEHEGTRRFLEEGDPPDGIFYSNDYHAIAGMQQIKAAGLRIPEDVRVIGFDDLSLARFAEPALTTIRQDHEQLGREAARLLVEQVERNPGERFAMRKTIIPVELVERDSA